MTKDYKPPKDAAEVFSNYKALYEGERDLKPSMREMAQRELKAGATVGQLARLTGLTPEVFRRMARELGVEHKRPPTVGKLSPAPPVPAAPARTEDPARAPAAKSRRRPQPEARDGRPLTDEEAKTLAATALERADEMQGQKLRQITANAAPGYEDYAAVSSALDMGLLTHDEVYGEPEERPLSSEEKTG
jgi:hypothetical protein